jgi:hypothetical protein
MAGPESIGDQHTSFILYSGNVPTELRSDVEWLLSVLGRPEHVGNAVGNAQLNNNAGLASMYSLFAGALLSCVALS